MFGSFPHIEQLPSEDNPPHDPDKGFLLKITPIDIPVIASIKTKTPKNISMLKIKLILALFLYIILTDRVFTLTSKSVIL